MPSRRLSASASCRVTLQSLDQRAGQLESALAGQHPNEPRSTVDLDDDGGDLGADVHPGLGDAGRGRRPAGDPQQCEAGEVDAEGPQPGLLDGLDGAQDRLSHRGDKQQAHRATAAGVLGRALTEHDVVEDDVLDRHRQLAGDPVGEGLAERLLLQPGQLDLADDDVPPGHAEHHVLAEAGPSPGLLDRLGDAAESRTSPSLTAPGAIGAEPTAVMVGVEPAEMPTARTLVCPMSRPTTVRPTCCSWIACRADR